jgi:hypothetical protein
VANDVVVSLRLTAGRECLEANVDGANGCVRIVQLGGGTLAALIGEELAVRTRDVAFERALAAAQEIQDAEAHT